MKLTKFGHACVRLDADGGSLVLDPGSFAPDADLGGAADLLVTHEHHDHLDADRVVAAVKAGARLHTNTAVAESLSKEHGIDVHAVSPGDTFEVAGLDVRVVGGQHAEIYEGLPGIVNVGFVIDGVYHPGDSVHVPDVTVETLLVPAGGPWLKLAEALDFVRAVQPARAFPIHDALLSEIGNRLIDNWFTDKGQTDYRRLAPGEHTVL
jgi:L-ascorbate metabolism protein UlaG (beta-lactamase superfamily)